MIRYGSISSMRGSPLIAITMASFGILKVGVKGSTMRKNRNNWRNCLGHGSVLPIAPIVALLAVSGYMSHDFAFRATKTSTTRPFEMGHMSRAHQKVGPYLHEEGSLEVKGQHGDENGSPLRAKGKADTEGARA